MENEGLCLGLRAHLALLIWMDRDVCSRMAPWVVVISICGFNVLHDRGLGARQFWPGVARSSRKKIHAAYLKAEWEKPGEIENVEKVDVVLVRRSSSDSTVIRLLWRVLLADWPSIVNPATRGHWHYYKG